MNKLIAMIPARMGSKRIPKKNIRFIDGKPLIQYPIELAKDSGEFSEIYVNSESDLLGKLAESNNVLFHKRPESLSTDTATNQDFTKEFLENHECDYVVMVNPTSPLLRVETVKAFCEYVKSSDKDVVFSVISEQAESFYKTEPINFPLDRKINSQELVPVDKIVWALTAWKKEHFLAVSNEGKCAIFDGNIGLFEIPKDESCDLDTEEDWRIAEGILVARKTQTEPKYWDA